MSIKEIKTGQDSFLDIVANLVGILIILVVVVGAQATSVLHQPKPKAELVDAIQQLEDELLQTLDVAAKVQLDNEQLEDRIIKENQLAADLTDQRHEMLMRLEIAKRQIEEQKKKRAVELEAVDAQERELLRRQEALAEQKALLEDELETIIRETNAVAASTPKSEVINHFPNPIAKTVFAEEVHFRLSEGKLSYVPMDELIMRMKSEWKVKAEKLRQADRTVETIGPIGNYRMQYELASENVDRNPSSGAGERRSIRFKQFSLYPLARDFGETLVQAFDGASEFQNVLSRHEPRKTTVSIWVYPDSFEEHGELKSWLHENGYQMASWPLDFGKRISGGPNGFKTSAQ